MAASSHIKDPNREQRDFTSRVIVLFLLALLAIFVLLARMIHLQVADYEKYRTRSDQNRIQVQPIGPPRGLIFDRNGVLLADNQPVFTLGLVAEQIGDLPALIAELRTLVEIDERDVEVFNKRFERRRRPFESVPLKVVLSETEIAALAVNRFRLPGVVVEAQLVRHYPMGALMGHAIGSVRRVSEDDLKALDPVGYSATQFIGKLGVERVYERSLHGEVGYQQVETDARGRIRKVLSVQPPVAGQNLTLQLDSQLQVAATAARRRGRDRPAYRRHPRARQQSRVRPEYFRHWGQRNPLQRTQRRSAHAAVQSRDEWAVRAGIDVQTDGCAVRARARRDQLGPHDQRSRLLPLARSDANLSGLELDQGQ